MSREVRRVPLDFKHPKEHNPNWAIQASTPYGRSKPESRLLEAWEMFTPLYETQVSVAQKEWDEGKEKWDAGTHEHLVWSLEYHSEQGWTNHAGERQKPHPYEVYDESGKTVIRTFWPTSVDEIRAVETYEEYASDRPTPAMYMPDFDVPEEELGWCLYETISEGSPVTPVFATSQELIDHLVTVGQDWDQVPMRRASAEAIISQGGTMATMVMVGGALYKSDVDADLIAALPRKESS